ncbi:mevalonate kinase-like protein [Leptotrombidium deliense]|uniref:Mevalonate kinase n=1 Tax=Leptotrombidium deliense TaxID=299467 RepID=A0A443S7S7_9ACAR|nr:mevalonate kinase-like protein [Leptotrombidium deliense]
MAKIIESSAPGKVILHGEHAVVFGKNAVAVSVDLRTKVKITLDNDSQDVHLKLNDFEWETKWSLSELINAHTEIGKTNLEFCDSFVAKCEKLVQNGFREETVDSVRAFLFLYFGLSDVYCSSKLRAMNVSICSSLPIGAGLGSSAAFSVSLTGALFRAFNVDASPETVSKTAFQVERMFHGKPSGIDNSICTFGGALLFKSGSVIEQVTDADVIPILLVYTNVKRNTKNLVKSTTERREKFSDVMNNIMNAIDAISLLAWKHIRNKDNTINVETLVEINQHLLNGIGAGHPSIDVIVEMAKKYGFRAKLTGAGGGGTVIVHLSKGNL